MEACLLDVQPHTVASVAAQHCASAADSGSGVSVRENGRSGRTGDRNVDLSSASKALELQGNVSESVREMVGNLPMCDFLSSPLTAQHLQCSSSIASEKRVDSGSNGPGQKEPDDKSTTDKMRQEAAAAAIRRRALAFISGRVDLSTVAHELHAAFESLSGSSVFTTPADCRCTS